MILRCEVVIAVAALLPMIILSEALELQAALLPIRILSFPVVIDEPVATTSPLPIMTLRDPEVVLKPTPSPMRTLLLAAAVL